MLIRRVHRNKEGHYTRAPLDIRCAAVKGVQMVFLLSGGIYLPTLPPPGLPRERGKREGALLTDYVFLISPKTKLGL